MALPPHLDGSEARGCVENEPIAQFEIGPARNLIYLVLDWAERKAALVDPQQDLTEPMDVLRRHGFMLTQVLLTHSHWDHVAGVPELVRTHPDVPIHCHPRDHHRLADVRLVPLGDGESVQVGRIRVELLHTPGHSAGGCVYRVHTSPPYLLTGDTLFIRDCGRTDLETGDTGQMFDSLQRIKALRPELIILPGHHYAKEVASVLERELRESGPLRVTSVAELQSLP